MCSIICEGYIASFYGDLVLALKKMLIGILGPASILTLDHENC